MTKLIALLLVLVACDQARGAGDLLKGGATAVGVAHGEVLCAIHPDKCGRVYACETPAENELGQIEICIQIDRPIADAEAIYGHCELSHHERFDNGNLCYWHCGEGAGCNAYNGCWCPEP